MAGLFETIRTRADATENEQVRRFSRRYLSLLDVGVLLLTLLVFMAFLLLLNNFVFPQGTRLGEIAARDTSGQSMIRSRGGLGILDDNDITSDFIKPGT